MTLTITDAIETGALSGPCQPDAGEQELTYLEGILSEIPRVSCKRTEPDLLDVLLRRGVTIRVLRLPAQAESVSRLLKVADSQCSKRQSRMALRRTIRSMASATLPVWGAR